MNNIIGSTKTGKETGKNLRSGTRRRILTDFVITLARVGTMMGDKIPSSSVLEILISTDMYNMDEVAYSTYKIISKSITDLENQMLVLESKLEEEVQAKKDLQDELVTFKKKAKELAGEVDSLRRKMNYKEEAKDKGNFYVEYDADTSRYCVYHTESLETYSSHITEEEAETKAREMNAER